MIQINLKMTPAQLSKLTDKMNRLIKEYYEYEPHPVVDNEQMIEAIEYYCTGMLSGKGCFAKDVAPESFAEFLNSWFLDV